MDTFLQDREEMDAVLQEMSLEELHGFAQASEDDSSQNEGQNELLSSIYFFIFLKTRETKYLDEAIRKGNDAVAATPSDHPERAARLGNLGNRLVGNPTSLSHAARLGFTEIVKLLLEKGAEDDATDEDGGTALYYAAENGHQAVVQLLLGSGAGVDMKVGGCTQLHIAASRGHETVVRLLLDNGADREAKDKDGDTALLSAAYHGHKAIVQLLLERQANVKSNGTNGTALQWALRQGHEEVAQLLLKNGAVADMKDDTNEALGSVAKGQLLQDIERAQEIMLPISSIESWAQNLRFVVSAADSDYDFELIETNRDKTTSEPYIAVSYCWGENTCQEKRRILVPSRKQHGTQELRDVRARSDILLRSLAFAAAKGIRKIWIDQECIHQDDEEDVRMAVQSMHIVYQRAAITLVVMDCHVQTLDDVYALPNIKRFGVYDELRRRIVRDKWFTRAWTTQELASSPVENLSYLIGWKDDVDISGDAWEFAATASNIRGEYPIQSVRRAWELDHGKIFDILHMCPDYSLPSYTLNGNPLFGALDPSEIIFTLIDDNIESMYWWKYMESSNAGSRCTPSTSQKLNMPITGAFTLLLGKGCMLFSDKLAILGNLVNYPYRIDTKAATREHLSLSACAIALALYNGDLSPLFCKRAMAEKARSMRDTEIHRDPLASWLPFDEISLSVLLQTPSTNTRFLSQPKNGSKCLVSHHKIMVKGLLWGVEPFHELNDLRDDICKQQQSSEANNRGKYTTRFSFFQLLVRRLLTLGRRDILELIILAVMGRQFTSPNEIFHFIYELEEWFHGERFWPAHIAEETFLERTPISQTKISVMGEERGMKNALTYTNAKGVSIALAEMEEPLAERSKKSEKSHHLAEEGRPIMTWIYNAVHNGLPLALGRCNVGEETLVSIFTFDPAKYRTVFTPLSELEYEFGKNPWIHLFPKDSFWCVRVCKDKVSEIDIQRAREKLGDIGDSVNTHEIYVSDQILEVEDSATKEDIKAVWSPRLSRIGMLTREQEGKSWKRVPFGQAAGYFWLR